MTNEQETCDGRCDATGKCDPTHPVHCCHLVVTSWQSWPWLKFRCVKCGKGSRTTTRVGPGNAPAL